MAPPTTRTTMPADVTTTETIADHPAITPLTETMQTRLPQLYADLALGDPTVSILLTDDPTIRDLNARWRDVDEATDVLSFPAHPPEHLPDEARHLGDIVISIPCAERYVQRRDHRRRMAEELGVDAEKLDWSLVDEVHFLFVHGLLHLLGYDHGEPDEEAEMRSLELRLWRLMTER